MRKIQKTSKLLALTLTASLATFGCTTNWNRSNGEPANGAAGASAPSVTPGSSGGTVPQPMTSSSQLTNRTPEQALAVMQQTLPLKQGRYLGVVNPPNTGEARIGGNATPSFDGTIRQLTVNSSIANPYGPQPAVISTDDAGVIFNDAVAGSTVVNGTTATTTGAGIAAGTTVTGSAATTTTTQGGTSVTPTSASLPVTSGAFSAATGTLTPTASSSAVPSATVATSPVILSNTGMLSSSTISNSTSASAPVTVSSPVTTSNASSRTTASSNGSTTSVVTSPNAISSGSASIAPLRLNRAATTSSATSAITVTQSSTGKLVISNQK